MVGNRSQVRAASAARSQVSSPGQLKRSSSTAQLESQQATMGLQATQVETAKKFVLTVSSLSGATFTVQASRNDTCAGVQQRVAVELSVAPYRVTISTGSGVMFDAKKTMEECAIFEDAQLFVVIGAPDRWREMSQDSFIELVVSRRLDTQENLLRSLRSLRSLPAKFDEMEFRQRYIPRLEAIETAEERKRLKEEHRQRVQYSVESEVQGMVADLGVSGAANQIQAKLRAIEADTQKKVAESRAIKEDAQRDLDAALPALQGAIGALQCLTKADLQEVKAFNNPPPLVAAVGEAMCILFGEKPTWDNTKKLWNDCHILHRMLDYDKDNISPRQIRMLDTYMQRPEFVPDAVGRASRAATGMCQWVRAMHVYDAVAKAVEPKRVMLREAEEDLKDTMWELDLWRKHLAEVLSHVNSDA